jgi:hypothetical protein
VPVAADQRSLGLKQLDRRGLLLGVEFVGIGDLELGLILHEV